MKNMPNTQISIAETTTRQKPYYATHGSLGIESPRDRKSSFEPKIIKKYLTRFQKLDEPNHRPLCQRTKHYVNTRSTSRGMEIKKG